MKKDRIVLVTIRSFHSIDFLVLSLKLEFSGLDNRPATVGEAISLPFGNDFCVAGWMEKDGLNRRERPMCRSETSVNRPFPIIQARFVIVPAERHIGRSLRCDG